MEANRSVDPSGGRPKLIQIRSVFFLSHAGKSPGVREVLVKVVPENETAAAKP